MKRKYNIFEFVENYVVIYLVRKNGEEFKAFIDKEDFDKVKNMCWHITWHKNFRGYYVENTQYLGYKEGRPKYKTLFLHRIVLEYNENDDVNHIDGNTLDNRKKNLRIIKHSDNSKNRFKKNLNNKTGYRNVCYYNGKFIVQLQANDKNKILGKFDNLEEAHKFAEEMRQKYYGEYSGTNK